MKYETRIKTIVVAPVGEPMFSEHATEISIDDEGAGEYVTITQYHGGECQTILLSPGSDLELVLCAVRRLAKTCR